MFDGGKTKRLTEEARSALEKERALRIAAEEKNRMKDEFLATLSHELRTPLNAIVGWAHILQTGDVGPVERARAIETILRNAKLQASLIEDLLDVSRIISGKLRLELEPLDFKKAIETAIEAATPSANAKRVRLEFSAIDTSLLVMGDIVRLQQIVWNLLTNAIKFSDPGGSVQLRIERVGHEIELEVKDHGRGIQAGFLPFLFERFRQDNDPLARQRGAGLGLGLAIVRYLAEAHGGRIQAASLGIGHGATFTLTLPASTTASATDGHAPSSESLPRQLAGARILVVDDDPDSRELVAALLARDGAQTVLAASAEEAREALSRRHPDVIVCDVGMPEEDGYTFMRWLRAAGEEAGAFVPALALTGHASRDDARVALLSGFQLHVSKPLDPPELLTNIAKLWRRGTT